jgi:prepilin-type N-terminal cleavage/methylation domain-containing protein
MIGRRTGFSLVEILIVLTIMAIIAAIAVPRLVEASVDTKESALSTDLQMLRRQILVYKMQHRDIGPHLDQNGALDKANLPARLIGRTDDKGKINPAGSCGPYMKAWPQNPFCPADVAGTVTFGTDTAAPRNGATGWYYNITTCIISPNSQEGAKALDVTD